MPVSTNTKTQFRIQFFLATPSPSGYVADVVMLLTHRNGSKHCVSGVVRRGGEDSWDKVWRWGGTERKRRLADSDSLGVGKAAGLTIGQIRATASAVAAKAWEDLQAA